MTYTWTNGAAEFDINAALSGTLVGFEQTESYDLSKTGRLTDGGGYAPFKVIIAGVTLWCDEVGKVVKTIPADSPWAPQTTGEGEQAVTTYSQLQMVTAVMGNTGAVGSEITRSSGSSGTGHDDKAILSNIEPRDQFAVQVLNAMLIHAEHPESFDDATCLMFCRASYRWAQAMMIAAADSREGQSTTPSTGVNVNSGDLQSNTEKLLYNIGEYMKNGMAVKGSAVPTDKPVFVTEQILSTQTNVTIEVSVVNKKCVKFVFLGDYAASDLSVYVTLTCKVGETTGVSRSAGFVIPKGSTVFVGNVDPDITEITALSSPTVRGKGSSLDSYNYMMSLAT